MAQNKGLSLQRLFNDCWFTSMTEKNSSCEYPRRIVEMCIEPPGTILMTLWLRWNEWLELWLMDIMYAIHIHVTINHSHSQKWLLFFFIMNNTRSGIVTVRGKGHFHFAESTSSGATNIYILQSQILCPTIREIFRITFNILWEKVSIIREIFKYFVYQNMAHFFLLQGIICRIRESWLRSALTGGYKPQWGYGKTKWCDIMQRSYLLADCVWFSLTPSLSVLALFTCKSHPQKLQS